MVFYELPAFAKVREHYLDDAAYMGLQNVLIANPEAGTVISGTGGLRKIRYGDEVRGKGKRSGLRVIYFWKDVDDQIWLFAVYDKDEADDLSADQRKVLKSRLQSYIKAGVLK
ncbi:MAG: toxin [Pseudomonadota bacterium]